MVIMLNLHHRQIIECQVVALLCYEVSRCNDIKLVDWVGRRGQPIALASGLPYDFPITSMFVVPIPRRRIRYGCACFITTYPLNPRVRGAPDSNSMSCGVTRYSVKLDKCTTLLARPLGLPIRCCD